MLAGKYLLLEDLCSAAFVDTRDFQNLSSIHIRVGSSAHDRNATDHAFVDLRCALGLVSHPKRVDALTWTEE